VAQLQAKKHYPLLFWLVILATSTAGTTMSDFMDRTLELGYATGSLLLATLLCIVLVLWKWSQKTLAVNEVRSTTAEMFYWAAILVSNTLGTAVGDYLADSSGLGFSGGALLIASIIAVLALMNWFTSFSKVGLFWMAFVLTRPLGATLGDWMTKPISHGGMSLGTQGSSLVLLVALLVPVVYMSLKDRDQKLSTND